MKYQEGIRAGIGTEDYDFDYSHDEPDDILTLKFPDQGLRKRRISGLELFYFYKTSKTTCPRIKSNFLVWIKKSANIRVEISNFLQRALITFNHYHNLSQYDIVLFPPSNSLLLKRVEKFLRSRHLDLLFYNDIFVKDSSNIDYSQLEHLLDSDISPSFRAYVLRTLKLVKRSGTLEVKKIPKPFVQYIHNFISPNPAYSKIERLLKNKRILVVDDYCFSGTTLKEVNNQVWKFDPYLVHNFVLISR